MELAISLFLGTRSGPTVRECPRGPKAARTRDEEARMFIFDRPFQAPAAGISVALSFVLLNQLADSPAAAPGRTGMQDDTPALESRAPHEVSSAPVRDLSLSCRLPPASYASWLPSLKSRIVPDQVAACAGDSTDLRSALLLVMFISGVRLHDQDLCGQPALLRH